MNFDIPIIILILLPLIGFLINFSLGNKMPKSLVSIIGCGTILVSFAISVWGFFLLAGSESTTQFNLTLFNWISAAKFSVDFSFLVDHLSIIMLLIITGVGFLIHLYSVGYMHDDPAYFRFFAYLNLFVFFMQMLVLGSNFLITFIGWEGVGLSSYLLIGFWFKNHDYNNAAKKAFIMNRVGDLGFLLALFSIYYVFGTLNFFTGGDSGTGVFGEATKFAANDTWLIIITLLLFLGATGKSAQIPLYTWLPDAMAGPTPVSALIHAATMVTAGIYLIVRSHILFILAPTTLEVIAVIGVCTAFFAATIGLLQNDIKKVLAYSTVSQLGYMFLALGVGSFSGAMFHLTTHAFFKALLFLGAGSVIHAMSGEQDIRNMGGLRRKLPLTFITFLAATLAISGIPPFAGFFSKDEILAKAFEANPVYYVIGIITAIFTAVYMFRLFYLTFYGKFRGTDEQAKHLHESPSTMTIPLIVLGILSVIGGFIGLPEVFGAGNALNNWLSPILSDVSKYRPETHGLSHTTEYILMGVSLLAVVGAILYARNKYIQNETTDITSPPQGLAKVLSNKYYIDEIYYAMVEKPLQGLSGIFYRIIDQNFIDGIVRGVSGLTVKLGSLVRLVQTGNIGFYLFAMVLGIILLILFNINLLP